MATEAVKEPGAAAEIMGEAEVGIRELAGGILSGGAALELFIDLVDHTEAGGADGVAETDEAAVGIDGEVAFEGEGTVEDIAAGLAGGREVEVFVDDELGDGETIVDQGEVELGAGVVEAGLVVGVLSGAEGLGEVGEIPVGAEEGRGRRRRGRGPGRGYSRGGRSGRFRGW